MTPDQVDACRKRNDALREDIAKEDITWGAITNAADDVDALIGDVERLKKTVDRLQRNTKELREELASEIRDKAVLKKTVTTLNGTLKKVKQFLRRLVLPDITSSDEKFLKDLLKDNS